MHLLVFGWLGAPAIALIVLAIAFGLPLVINNVLGPACKTYLRTAVQLEELPSLNRIGRTNRVLARIRPLISAVQGSMSQDEAAQRVKGPADEASL
jgi:hypothetical protein